LGSSANDTIEKCIQPQDKYSPIRFHETCNLNEKVKQIMEFRDNHVALEDHFIDVHYLDLASDPIVTVRAIHARFGLTYSVEDESRMAAFATSERNKRRPDKFSLADFTLGPEQQSPYFDSYCERFRVGRENL
jgi:hypothetical protein